MVTVWKMPKNRVLREIDPFLISYHKYAANIYTLCQHKFCWVFLTVNKSLFSFIVTFYIYCVSHTGTIKSVHMPVMQEYQERARNTFVHKPECQPVVDNYINGVKSRLITWHWHCIKTFRLNFPAASVYMGYSIPDTSYPRALRSASYQKQWNMKLFF